MIAPIAAIALIFLSIIYAKFFLRKICESEIKNFKKKMKIKNFKLLLLALFFLTNIFFIFLFETISYAKIVLLIFLVLAIVFGNKFYSLYNPKLSLASLLLYFISFPFLFKSLILFTMLAIVFNLIYFSLDFF